jgi:hypothetical protein
VRARVAVAILAAAVSGSGCGGGSEPVPALPPDVARTGTAWSGAVAASLEKEEWCQARNRLDQFTQIVLDANVTPEARNWLREEIATLRESVRCRGPAPEPGAKTEVRAFAERVAKAGGIEDVVDFRIPRELVAGADEHQLVVEAIDRMWWELETPYEPDARLAQASAGQRAVYALAWTASEVGNGGFEQYF